MSSRKEKVEAFLIDLQSLRRAMTFKVAGSAKLPRITPAQWGAFMVIEVRGESTVKEVAKALGITSSAATQLVDGLVEGGYVAKKEDSEDRRAVTLTLSKNAAAQVEKMKKRGVLKFLKLFEGLTDAELDQYLALNRKIVRKFLA